MNRALSRVIVTLGISALSACTTATYTPPNSGTTPSFITVTPTTLDFAGISTPSNHYAYDQTVTGTLTAPSQVTVSAASCLSSNGPIARVTNPVQNGLSLTVTVSPERAGSCTVTLTTATGSSATVSITVNAGSVGLSGKAGERSPR
jgi:hypothetical protein